MPRNRSATARTPAEQAMIGVLVLAGHVHRALADVCARYDITHDQYNVLRILRGTRPDGLPRYEISDRLMSRAPDVTRMLDRLERNHLVERVRSARDRRLSLTRITEDGLTLLERIDPEIRSLHETFAKPLSVRERRELARLCASVVP